MISSPGEAQERWASAFTHELHSSRELQRTEVAMPVPRVSKMLLDKWYQEV